MRNDHAMYFVSYGSPLIANDGVTIKSEGRRL